MPFSTKWDRNPDVAQLPALQVGDRVTLHLSHVWNLNVRADVQAISGRTFIATVVAVFDRETGTQVLGGNVVTQHVGAKFTFDLDHVFDILSP